MVRKPRESEGQVHPTGEMVSVDDQWKADARAELVRRNWSQADLAKKIPAAKGTITNLLKPIAEGGSRQSRLVGRIHKLFGWRDGSPKPAVAVVPDEPLRFIERKWPSLTEADRETVRRMVDSLTTKR